MIVYFSCTVCTRSVALHEGGYAALGSLKVHQLVVRTHSFSASLKFSPENPTKMTRNFVEVQPQGNPTTSCSTGGGCIIIALPFPGLAVPLFLLCVQILG